MKTKLKSIWLFLRGKDERMMKDYLGLTTQH
jgi:hypothetical protein